MAIINPSNVNEIEFDEQDIEVFKIPDVKERIVTLQKHFFPRLTQILHHSGKGLQIEQKYEKKGVVVNSNNDYGKHR